MKGDKQNAKRNPSRSAIQSDAKEGLQQGQSGSDCAVEHRNGVSHGQAAKVTQAKGAVQEVEKRQPVVFAESAYLDLTEERAREVLVKARGDLFICAQLLKISVIQLRHFIKGSTLVQQALKAAQEKAVEGDVTAMSDQEYANAIAERERLYRIVALDAMHDLAAMPISDNSSQNSVKLAAASRLAGPTAQESAGHELAETLRQLNESYQKQAPRIKVVRETLTLEPASRERDVTPQDS